MATNDDEDVHKPEPRSPGPLDDILSTMTPAQIVDRDWFSSHTPTHALTHLCEPIVANDYTQGGHREYLKRLDLESKTSTQHAPCTAVWLAGSVAYRCRTCQTGEQSSVCVACFKAGNHTGHDTIVYRSETGGACDCGDTEAWAVEGCCERHRPSGDCLPNRAENRDTSTSESTSTDAHTSTSTPSTGTPPSTSTTSTHQTNPHYANQVSIFGLVFERLLLSLESVAHSRGPNRPVPAGARRQEEERIASSLIDWLVCESQGGFALREAAAEALGMPWTRDLGNSSGNSSVDVDDGADGTSPPTSPHSKFAFMMQRTAEGHFGEFSSNEDSTMDGDLPVNDGSTPMNDGSTPVNDTIYSTETGVTTVGDVRWELRKRRVEVKHRCGNAPSNDWPIAGADNCGLLECLLRPSCMFSLPDSLMDECTTLLLTLLFIPTFKTKFGKTLVKHYDAIARFPETLPWPGVGYSRGKFPNIRNRCSLEFPEEIHIAASPIASNGDVNAASDRIVSGSGNASHVSRTLTAYASRRVTVCRCLDRVTVQLFGAAPIVAVPETRDDMLHATCEALRRCVVERNKRGGGVGDFDNYVIENNNGTKATYKYGSFDPKCEASIHRLFVRPTNDLRMLLTHRSAARRWLSCDGTSNVELFFLKSVQTLAALQGMHAYTHKRGEHVLSESNAWVAAVTAETFLTSAFKLGINCVADGLRSDKAIHLESSSEYVATAQDVLSLQRASAELFNAIVGWCELSGGTGSIARARADLFGNSTDHDLHGNSVSLHLPLHRLLATCVHGCVVAMEMLKDDSGDKGKKCVDSLKPFFQANVKNFVKFSKHPLRAIAFADQVQHRVWIRNGDELIRNALVYNSRFYAGMGRDADFGFTQISLALACGGMSNTMSNQSDTNVSEIVSFALEVGSAGATAPVETNTKRFPFTFCGEQLPETASEFGIYPSLEFIYPNPKTLPPGALKCARATARFLVSLTRNRQWLDYEGFDEKCTREIVHTLAVSPKARSALSEHLPSQIAAESADVDRLLGLIAHREESSSSGPSMYKLRPEIWGAAFDPFFLRYTVGEHDAALSEAVRLWVKKLCLKGEHDDQQFTWSPSKLLEPPVPPRSECFANLLEFTRDKKLAIFARDAICYLFEHPSNLDLQDLGISAMALIGCAVGGEAGGDEKRSDDSLPSYLEALFSHPDETRGLTTYSPTNTSNPYVLTCLEHFARGAGTCWISDDSPFTVLVSECAAVLVQSLRKAGRVGKAEKVKEPVANDETKTESDPTTTSVDRKEKLLAAKQRQKDMMQAMQAKQRLFADGLGSDDEDDDDEDDDYEKEVAPADATTAVASPPVPTTLPWDHIPECALCGETSSDAKCEYTDASLCWVARSQRNFTPTAGRKHNLNEQSETSTSEDVVLKKSIDTLECVGCLPVLCGHGAHVTCLQRYVTSTHTPLDDPLRDTTDVNDQALLRMEREARLGLTENEFKCPTCRRVCDVVVPVVAAPQAQLELARDSDEPSTSNTSAAMDVSNIEKANDEVVSSALSAFSEVAGTDSNQTSSSTQIMGSTQRVIREFATCPYGTPMRTQNSLYWLKLVQGVTHLQAVSRTRSDDDGNDARSDASAACDAGRWWGLRELTRRAVFAWSRTGVGVHGVEHTRDSVPTNSLTNALSAVFNDETSDDSYGNSSSNNSSLLLLSAARYDFLCERTAQLELAAERMKRRSRFGIGGRGQGTYVAVADTEVDMDTEANGNTEGGDAEREVTATVTHAVLAAQMELSQNDGVTEGVNMASSRETPQSYTSSLPETVTKPLPIGLGIFSGCDLVFLKKHPVGFFVESLARVSWNDPGVFSREGGVERVEKVAKAVVLAVLKMRLKGSIESSESNNDVSETSRLETLCVAAVDDVWRVDALLALIRGDQKVPESGYKAGKDCALQCVTRVLHRLGLGTVGSVVTALTKVESTTESTPALDAEAMEVDAPDSSPTEAPPLPSNTFTWSALSPLYEDVLLRFVDTKCQRCRLRPRDPAVCLECGEVFCCADTNCVQVRGPRLNSHTADDELVLGKGFVYSPEQIDTLSTQSTTQGACAAHASSRRCGAGSCCFLLLKSTKVLIIHSNSRRVCVHGSFYQDAHGEEDEHMKRGRPLFLDTGTVGRLRKLWASGALEHDTKATQGSRLGGEWY